MTASAPGGSRPPLVTTRRLAISLVLAVAVAALVAAFAMHQETEPVRLTNTAVRVVSPAPGERVPRQTTVFVELVVGYELDALQVNGRAVGPADMEILTGLNRFGYTPGEGKPIEEFDPDRNCATAEFHRAGEPVEPGDEYTWCFSLH